MKYQLINKIDLNLSPIQQILINRGIGLINIEHYINTTDKDILDPKLLDNIQNGAKLLISHITQNHDVLIQVDSDCDGYTSAALLINYLYKICPNFVVNHIKYRIHNGKEHGIIPETITENIKLVIAPDSASNQYEEHQKLAEKGIDILVLDHHEASEISQYACVINNQLCNYPTKSLSGVGIVYKFCSYLDELMETNQSEEFLDLVALGLVGDMMDLRDFETKHLITKGFQNISNPFFKTMSEKNAYSLGEVITPIGVAFYVVPYINAMIRMGEEKEKFQLFESMLEHKANSLISSTKRGCKGQQETLVEQACRNCTNIKNKQTKERDSFLNTIENIIKEKQLELNKIIAIKLKPEMHINKNLVGLIANQIMAKYQKPILLLNHVKTEDNNINWEGSGRGCSGSDFETFKEFLEESELVNWAEGHQNAFGVSISDENFNKLIEYSNNKLSQYNFDQSYKVDYIFESNDFNSNLILEIAKYKNLWGQNVSEPYIAIENINLTKNNIMLMSPDKKPTLKIKLANGVDLIQFGYTKEKFESIDPKDGCIKINIVGRCEQNNWNGIITPQIIIEDLEIVNKQEYYF